MLAQNFKTAADLCITDPELEALIKVLGMLERGDLSHDGGQFDSDHGFNMGLSWEGKTGCGTVACIGGWCEIVMGVKPTTHLYRYIQGGPLYDLYWSHVDMGITTDQAAIALRSYLTTGEPNWAEALA